MYGLRDAPQIWQQVVQSMLRARGFKALVGTQCVYHHPGSHMMIVAHVDDFLVLGKESELRDLLKGLQKDYECDGQILGYSSNCHSELKFLGRQIRLTNEGLEWEGDPKHAKAFVDKMTELFAERPGSEESGVNSFMSIDVRCTGGSRLDGHDRHDLTYEPDGYARVWDEATGECIMQFSSSPSLPGDLLAAEWRPQKTPGVKKSEDEIRIPLWADKAKAYRGLAAL